MNSVTALTVMLQGRKVGELVAVPRGGIYFGYDQDWLASGFNLAPFHMEFSSAPQMAADTRLFDGLHGAFSDSLPDGWGLLLMDRFFQSEWAMARHAIGPLDRLAYMGNRSMGALEYVPMTENSATHETVDLAALYEASLEVLAGETEAVLKTLRLAGGSPGGARPKAVIGLSADRCLAISSFDEMPAGYEHWMVKFRSQDEARDSGAIEHAYSMIARDAGIEMSESTLLHIETHTGPERFFATRRFDRSRGHKLHVLTASAVLYADFRAPSLDYGDLLRATWVMTRDASQVEKVARLMVFNAMAHNRDDHAKNFGFLGGGEGWHLAPAYDLTFSTTGGLGNEHTTAFAGAGKPTRKAIKKVCQPFSFLTPDLYIEQTLDAFSQWSAVNRALDVDKKLSSTLLVELERVWKEL
ncbi:MAG: type II toxin-antitoxin system HipA family toxin [Pseudomonas sp.]